MDRQGWTGRGELWTGRGELTASALEGEELWGGKLVCMPRLQCDSTPALEMKWTIRRRQGA